MRNRLQDVPELPRPNFPSFESIESKKLSNTQNAIKHVRSEVGDDLDNLWQTEMFALKVKDARSSFEDVVRILFNNDIRVEIPVRVFVRRNLVAHPPSIGIVSSTGIPQASVIALRNDLQAPITIISATSDNAYVDLSTETISDWEHRLKVQPVEIPEGSNHIQDVIHVRTNVGDVQIPYLYIISDSFPQE